MPDKNKKQRTKVYRDKLEFDKANQAYEDSTALAKQNFSFFTDEVNKLNIGDTLKEYNESYNNYFTWKKDLKKNEKISPGSLNTEIKPEKYLYDWGENWGVNPLYHIKDKTNRKVIPTVGETVDPSINKINEVKKIFPKASQAFIDKKISASKQDSIGVGYIINSGDYDENFKKKTNPASLDISISNNGPYIYPYYTEPTTKPVYKDPKTLYTGSKALKIQGKPSGYINKGNNTGRQEIRKGGWLDGLDEDNPIQDNTKVKAAVIPNQALIQRAKFLEGDNLEKKINKSSSYSKDKDKTALKNKDKRENTVTNVKNSQVEKYTNKNVANKFHTGFKYNEIQISDNTRVSNPVIPNQTLIQKSNLNKNKGTLKSIDKMPVQPLTKEEVRKGVKFTTDVAGMFNPIMAVAGSAMDMHQGDKTGAAIGLVPGLKSFIASKNMATKLATKMFNAGIPNKIVTPIKKGIREAGNYISGTAEVIEAKDDIGKPIVETVKSKLRNGGQLDGLDNNKTEQAPDVTNATEYVKGWYNSPMYDNILRNQNIDLGITNPNRLERRVKQHKKYYNESNYNVTPSVVENLKNYGEGYIDNKGNKQINLNKNFVQNNPKLVNSLFAHELTHDNLMTVKDREYINKNTPEYNPALHKEDTYNKLTDPEEVRSQIHSIRQLSGENKIYDPLTQPFKKEYLDKVNESYNQGTKESEDYNQLQRLRQYYSDDQITEMMNTISKSNSNDGKVYAKNGGLLNSLSKKRFDMGGPVNDEENSDILPSWDAVKATLNPYNWGVDDYTKSGTRGQAFNAARKAGEEEFMWNNQRYNTRKDTDYIPYIGSNPNQKEYDNFLRKEYPEFFKTLNRGKNVGSITWKGASDKEPNRASIKPEQTNSNINVGENPESGHEFIDNIIAESSHLKDPKLFENIFNPYEYKTAYEYIRHGEERYKIPGTAEYDAHRLREPGMAMIAYGNLSPNNIKQIQKNLGVKDDGYFGPDTYKAMQSKYASNLNVKAALLEHKLRYRDNDKNPSNFGDDINLVRAYLREIESEVPFKNSGQLSNNLTANKDYTDNALNNIIPGSGDYNVKKLQTTLVNKGYKLPKSTTKYRTLDGTFDGIYGPETNKALLDYQSKNAKSKLRNGGWLDGLSNPNNVIEDNRGQWAHPGKVTKINSNQITMKGVNYPVLGVSDSGDTQMMKPGGEYNFKGKTVTEYPQKFQLGGFKGLSSNIPKNRLDAEAKEEAKRMNPVWTPVNNPQTQEVYQQGPKKGTATGKGALEPSYPELMLMPGSLPIKAASKLGKAAVVAAEALNPIGGMRNLKNNVISKSAAASSTVGNVLNETARPINGHMPGTPEWIRLNDIITSSRAAVTAATPKNSKLIHKAKELERNITIPILNSKPALKVREAILNKINENSVVSNSAFTPENLEAFKKSGLIHGEEGTLVSKEVASLYSNAPAGQGKLRAYLRGYLNNKQADIAETTFHSPNRSFSSHVSLPSDTNPVGEFKNFGFFSKNPISAGKTAVNLNKLISNIPGKWDFNPGSLSGDSYPIWAKIVNDKANPQFELINKGLTGMNTLGKHTKISKLLETNMKNGYNDPVKVDEFLKELEKIAGKTADKWNVPKESLMPDDTKGFIPDLSIKKKYKNGGKLNNNKSNWLDNLK